MRLNKTQKIAVQRLLENIQAETPDIVLLDIHINNIRKTLGVKTIDYKIKRCNKNERNCF